MGCEWVANTVTGKWGERLQIFDASKILVPVPRSALTPNPPDPDSWSGLRLANAINKAAGMSGVVVALRRVTELRRASECKPGNRPTVQEHLDSLGVDVSGLRNSSGVILIDDILTRGTQLMGAMRKLRLGGFTGKIDALTAAHTVRWGIGREDNQRSTIIWFQGDTYPERRPERRPAE